MKFHQSLKFQLPFFVLLGVIPVVSLAIFFAGSIARNSIKNKTEEVIDLETQLIASTVNKWDEMNVLALRHLSKQPEIVSMDADRQRPILKKLVDNYDPIYRAMTFNTEGWNIARNDSNRIKYYGDRKYFQGPISGEDITYQSIFGRTSKKLAVCMGTKIINSDVETVGVTVICSSLKQMTKELGNLKFGKTGYVTIVDRDGNVLAHPNPSYVIGDELKNIANYAPVKNLLTGGDKEFSYLEDGKEWISRSTRLSNGWGVVIAIEKAEFLGDEHYFTQLMLIFGAASIFILGTFIWLLANRLISPITNLTENAISITKGNLNSFVQVERKDELGILGRSFNAMIQQLRSQLIHLEDTVKERTADLKLAHNETKFALQEAREADKAKENFLLKISHELKTPLNAIIGYSQQILATNSSEHRVNIINQSGLHLLAMLDDIFQFNQLKSEALNLNFKTINLPLLCKSVVDIVFLEGQKKNISVRLLLNGDIPQFIKTDEKRLRQVLINLLSNGVKFTDKGEVILKLTRIDSGVTSAENNCLLQFEVIDTGIGISSENLPKIFAPFFQVNSSKGTGLGLNISQEIISAMGAEIKVESQLHRGSKFEFKLMVERIAIPDANCSLSVIKGYKGNKQKILVIDDILASRLLLKSVLVPLGFEIIEASNGKEGLDLAKAHDDIDLIITDLLMPTKSGLTMIFQIKGMSKYQNIPILAISSSLPKITHQNCIGRDYDVFLNKPIERAELILTLEKLLNLEWIEEPKADPNLTEQLEKVNSNLSV